MDGLIPDPIRQSVDFCASCCILDDDRPPALANVSLPSPLSPLFPPLSPLSHVVIIFVDKLLHDGAANRLIQQT